MVEIRRPPILCWIELGLLSVIILIAAGLRLGWPGTVAFAQDEANFSRMALDLVRGVEFPLLSIDSSVGIRNPPMTVYIMALPYLFTTDPVIATSYVGVLGVLAVMALYALVRRGYGVFPALMAAALFATNPWMVLYARKIWDLLPLFLLLMLLTGAAGFIDGRRWGQLLHLPLLSVIGQIHYATVALLPVTVFLVIVGRRRIKREFWLSLPLMIVITLPFLIGAAREGYFSPEALRRLTNRDGKTTTITYSGVSIRDSLLVIAGAEAFSAPGTQRYADEGLMWPEGVGGTAVAIIGGLVIIAVGWAAVRTLWKRDRRAAYDGLWSITLVTTPILFSLTWTALYTHYLIPVIPAAFTLISAFFGDLRWLEERFRLIRPALTAVMIVTVVGSVTFQAVSVAAHIEMVDRNATPGVFPVPLRYLMPARNYLLSLKPDAILATVEGQYIGYHSEATVWNLLLHDIPLRRFMDDNIEVYPATPTPFLSHRCTAPGGENWYFRGGEGCLNVRTRSKADFPAAQFRAIPDTKTVQNGIRPTLYRWTLDPQPCLALAWEPSGPVPEEWQVKVHFTDAEGKVIAYADGEFWRGRYWRAGDVIVRTHCLSDANKVEAIRGVRIGMYQQIEGAFRDLAFVDTVGQAVGVELAFALER